MTDRGNKTRETRHMSEEKKSLCMSANQKSKIQIDKDKRAEKLKIIENKI